MGQRHPSHFGQNPHFYKAAAANDQIVSQSSLLLIAKSGQVETVCFDKSFRTQMVSRPYKMLDTIAIKCLHEPFTPPPSGSSFPIFDILDRLQVL